MIPKTIHYCWFGRKPLPPLAEKCIASWKKYLPDYEIIEWNEDNFDINGIPYTKEAYQAGKYAFVSDYARFWILYHYGGLYFDTDVEVIKSIDDIISKGPFMGREILQHESGDDINPGLGIGAAPEMEIFKEVLNVYKTKRFYNNDSTLNLTTVVTVTTKILSTHEKHQLDNNVIQIGGINIYPTEYFCPKNYYTGEMMITSNTVAIHHYDASWKSNKDKLKRKIINILGERLTRIIVKFKHLI